MANLGRALTILLRAYQREHAMHEDVDAFYAPGECHDLVSRGEGKRLRFAVRHACAVAGVKNARQLRRTVRAAIGNDASIYRRYGFVPY